MEKINVGILGATGMVGQRFISLLDNHPWFNVTTLAASPRSSNKSYSQAVEERWSLKSPIPESVKGINVQIVEDDLKSIADNVDLVFSALDMDKEKIREIENNYAKEGVAVVSNNSAHRWTDDVPMIMPEVNSHHAELIKIQRENRNWTGLIAVKPNCSIQSYVPPIDALKTFIPKRILVTTLQAISGAGKTFESWPEMVDNVIPFIGGEEGKSEKEPMRIWGNIQNGKIELATQPEVSATCIRVPASDGHMASVSVEFENSPSKEQIIEAWSNFKNPIQELNLPSAPNPCLKYFDEEDRPQTKLDRDFQNGMGITMGRLREDPLFQWKFVCLSHNTVRGAAGGAVLVAELLKSKGYF
ncbi:aspartate-semialdehyde dehydrogenase [Nanoarchaeota archaeon]